MIIEDWFPTPIGYLYDYDLARELLPVARDTLNNSINLNEQYSKSTGVNSRITLNKTNSAKDPRLENANKKLCEYSRSFLSTTGYQNNLSTETSNLYFNNLSYGGSQPLHIHELSPVTGVMYLETDQDSSPTVFTTPLDVANFTFAATKTHATKYNASDVYFLPEPGKILMFPGWLKHHVPVNYTNVRVVLTFIYYYDYGTL